MEKIQRQASILRRWMVYSRLPTGKMNCLKGTGGSVFIGLIITMVVIAGLGAAMLPLSTTSTRSQITGNQAQEGYYLAESGMRYIASEFKHSADGLENDVCAAEDARDNVLKANHSQTFTVNDKGAYFDLDIVPYYFKVHPDLVVSPNLKAAVFGGIPSEIPTVKPGYLQIIIKNDQCTLLSARHDYHYTGVSKSGDDIMFNGITLAGGTPEGNAIPTQNDRIFPACMSAGGVGAGGVQTVIKDGNLTFQADTGADIFPAAGATFKINGAGDVYKYQELDLANNMLKGITKSDGTAFTLTLRDTDYIVAQRFIKLTSRGSAGASSATASAAVAFDLSVGDSEGGGAQGVLYGLFGNTLVEIKNSGQIKSYNSKTHPTPSSSTGEGDICSNLLVNLKNSSYVDGDVVIGKDTSGNQGTYTNNGSSTVTGSAPVNVDRVDPDPLGAIGGALAAAFTKYSSAQNNDNAGLISGNVISLKNSETMTLVGKSGGANYYMTGITLKNSSILFIDATNGPVNIYLAGILDVKNSSRINLTGNPPDFTIYCNDDSNNTINLKNGTLFKGAVYAPYGDILVHNSTVVRGMLWGKMIEVKNSGDVWFDTALKETIVFAGSGGGSQSLKQ